MPLSVTALAAVHLALGGGGRAIDVLFINNSNSWVDFDGLGHPIVIEARTARFIEIGIYDGLDKEYEVRDSGTKVRYKVVVSGPAAELRTVGDVFIVEYPILPAKKAALELAAQNVEVVKPK